MFQIAFIPYYCTKTGEIFYAHPYKERPCSDFSLTGLGKEGDSLRKTAIHSFAKKTGMFLNPICFQELITKVTLPIVEIEHSIQDENILMILRYYFSVQFPRKIERVSSQQIGFVWRTYQEAFQQEDFIINKYALWELNERLITHKRDISINQKAIQHS